MPAERSCAILVLNWNGIAHLEHLLPTLREAVRVAGGDVPIVVVDNRSTGGDVEWIGAHFPEVEVVVAPRNDYLFSLNDAVAARTEDVVVILNNDMRVAPDFLPPLLAHFEDPDVFAASALVLDWEGTRRTTGQRLISVRRFWVYREWRLDVDEPVYTLEGGGGCAAFDRRKFVALGGFDPLYRPGYFEDIDLSFRAWQRGWRSVFEPRSVIYHRVGATLANDPKARRLDRLLNRNLTLFTLKNVDGWGFLAGFLLLLPVRILRSLLRERDLALGVLAAAPRAGVALRSRLRAARSARRPTDAIAADLRRPLRRLPEPAGTR